MSERFQVTARLAARLEDLGVSPLEVLRHAGLREDLLEPPRVLVSTEELFALWRGIGAISRDPAIGLRLGSEETVEQYEPIAIAALCARSSSDSLERIARYKQLTCPEKIEITRGQRESAVQFRWLLAQEAAPGILTDLCFSWILTILRRGTGESIVPLRVELNRPAENHQIYSQFFSASVQFSAGRDALIFRTEDIERPFRTHNPELLAMVAPALEEELNRRSAQQSVPERVRRIVQARMAGRRPILREVARELKMSVRTLQRRLLEHGATFQQVVEDARRELAKHYLVHSPLELHETAYLLGYEDANSFVRAFHTWEGMPPAHWRATQRGFQGVETRVS